MTEQQYATCPACGSEDIFPFRQTLDYRLTQEAFALDKCPQCGLVMTNPRPSQEEIGKYYDTEDYISHAASARSVMDRIYYWVRSRMAQRKRHLIGSFTTGRSLLDIGAGAGYFTADMQRHGWEVTGFEPSAQARLAAHEAHGVSLQDMDQLFEQPDRSADAVTMWHVLEHVHQLDAYLRTIHRILKTNGVFFLALPNYTCADAQFYRAEWAAWDVPRHLWHFSPEAAGRILDRYGFNLITTYRMPFDAWYVALVSEQYRGGGFLRTLRAAVIALVSNGVALCSRRRSSSLIYVARKQTHA